MLIDDVWLIPVTGVTADHADVQYVSFRGALGKRLKATLVRIDQSGHIRRRNVLMGCSKPQTARNRVGASNRIASPVTGCSKLADGASKLATRPVGRALGLTCAAHHKAGRPPVRGQHGSDAPGSDACDRFPTCIPPSTTCGVPYLSTIRPGDRVTPAVQQNGLPLAIGFCGGPVES